MAWEQPLFTLSFPAAKDLSSYQFELVQLTTDKKVTNITSSAAYKLGILQNNPTSGLEASVMVMGVSKAKLGGAVGVRQQIKSNGASTSAGGTIVAATSATKGHNIGYALEAGSATDIVTVVIGGLVLQV
jgi:hypothetical protein